MDETVVSNNVPPTTPLVVNSPVIPLQQTTTTTTTTDKPVQDESRVGSLTMRSILALALVLTVCIESFTRSGQIPETLIGLTSTVVAFYFGHEQGKLSK